MFIPTPLHPQSPKHILHAFEHQVKQWRLDNLLYQLLDGQHAAKCQFGWYLQYQIPHQEIDQFLHALNSIEQVDTTNPNIPLVKMIQQLYGLGVPPSLEHSRLYLQQYQERYASSSPDPNDIFLQTLAEVNRLSKFSRCQWFAAQGNGDAICDLAYYYLIEATNPEEVEDAINLLTAAANFNHYRALTELAALYREGKLIPVNVEKANHYARKAFLRKVLLHPDKQWQINDLPIGGYSERLAARAPERVYHESICLLYPEYDFLFAKDSTLVPLVHTPTSRGIVENIKTIVPYFIAQTIYYDKAELKSPRLKRALELLIQFYQLPKLQRDQIHLLLAYQHSLEHNPATTAQHIMAIKQPYAYMEVIQALDPEGNIGKLLLTFSAKPESKSFDEADALLDYALVYLIAVMDSLDNTTRYRLQQQLLLRFTQPNAAEISLAQLTAWQIQYCQIRYALYKIHRFLHVSSRGWHFRHQHQKKAQTAWQEILQELVQHKPLSAHNLMVIQDAYPLLSNSLDQLRHAPAVVLQRASMVSELLLKE